MPRVSTDARERWWRSFEPFWVTGLALLCLLIGSLLFRGPVFHLGGKPYDYAQYLAAGTVFPLALFGVPWLWRQRRLPWPMLRTARRVLAAGALLWCALFLAASVGKHGVALMALPPLLALAQTVLMWRPWRSRAAPPERLVAILVVAIIVWTVTIPLGLGLFVQPPVFLIGFAAALSITWCASWESGGALGTTRNRFVGVANGLAVVFIALMSLRTENLFEVLGDRGAVQHWSTWVGPAELTRQGGWLLWDVPSMYGFLSIVPLAALPATTPWQTLYLLQALSFFIVSVGLFLTLQALGHGWIQWCFALTLAIAAPFFLATFDATGPVISTFVLPNLGAYRYVWCFVLVLLLTWLFILDEDARCLRWLAIGGCLVWVVGVLWSAESAFYCSGVWLPAYAVIVFRSAIRSPRPWRLAMVGVAIPIVMLAAAIGLVSVIYLGGLSRAPDWAAYFDFAFTYGTEAQVVVNDPMGPVLGIFAGFCVLATAAWYAGMRDGVPTRSLALFAGLLGGYWATSLYGYARSYANWHPIAYVGLGITLVVTAQHYRGSSWGMVVRAAAAPLLTLLIVSPLAAVVASPGVIRGATTSVAATAHSGFAVEARLPEADASLQELMAEAEIDSRDPVSFQGSWIGNLLFPWRPGNDLAAERIVTTRDWLPGHPYVSLRYLPEGRGATYMRRFIDRVQRGGWLVQHKTGETAKPPDQHEFVSGREPWFFPTLGETHVPTRIFENEEWQLVWFDYVGRESDVVRPEYTEYRGVPPLLPDVTIDGQQQADLDDPAVWVLPGAGIGWYDVDHDARWVNNRAELWVYSRQPQALMVTLGLEPGAPAMRLLFGTVGLEDSAGSERPRRREGDESRQRCGRHWTKREREATTTPLQAGWNRVDLCLLASDDSTETPPDGWFVSGFHLTTSPPGQPR